MPAAQAWRTLRYSSTLKILAPSLLSQKGKGWTTFTPPAAAPCRRFRGLISHRRSQDDKILIQVINKIAGKIWELSPTELDLYRYMVEEADRFSKGGQYERNVLKASGIAPLEYEGEMSKADDFKKNRSALEYLDKDVFPKLERFLGAIRASETRAQIFALVVLREENAVGLLRLRQKYAIHYSNNCSKNGHWDSYDKWSEIIAIIEKAVERRSNGRDGK